MTFGGDDVFGKDGLNFKVLCHVTNRLIFCRQLTVHPEIWFVGQFVKYLMRLQPDIQQYLDAMEESLHFTHPIVG